MCTVYTILDMYSIQIQWPALARLERFCYFFLRSSFHNIFLAWLHSNCSMAHLPVELLRKLFTKPWNRANAGHCRQTWDKIIPRRMTLRASWPRSKRRRGSAARSRRSPCLTPLTGPTSACRRTQARACSQFPLMLS